MVDEGRVENAVYLDFSKVPDSFFNNILVMKLRKCRIDEWTASWTENWLSGRVQRAVVSGSDAGRRL